MSSVESVNSVFIYVVDRDFGFAPNPFHGYCTLATCKPHVRNKAQLGDWVIGMGGKRLRATGRCVFAMRVTDKTTFDTYWADRRHIDKRPIRNGSSRSMVGDNIYHFDKSRSVWRQADSHHSNADGTINLHNLANDTKSRAVLISSYFYYFGRGAPVVPPILLSDLGYKNRRQYFRFPLEDCADLLAWLENQYRLSRNLVLADPFDFDRSHSRFDGRANKVS
jgi:hypothetical protein